MNNNAVNISKLFSLKDKVALVTGATGHLGEQIVLALCASGAQVILNGRNKAKLEILNTKLQGAGFKTVVCQADLLNSSEVEQQLTPLLQRYGRLDVLINNAYAGKPGLGSDPTLTQFTQAYDICVLAAYHLFKICLPFLQVSQSGSVINIGTMYAHVSPDPSIYGTSGMNNPPYYGAAKAGLIQLTRYLACHYAKENIRVNSISPGPFPSNDVIQKSPEFIENLQQKVPMKRIGNASEIQGPILFLASEASSYITGTDIKVDGGWTAW